MSNIVEQLDPIFKPRSMAVIGASDNPAKWGHNMIERPLRTGYKGRIYPVNPQADTILGVPSYHSVKDIPEAVDLAVITVQANQVPAVMQAMRRKGSQGSDTYLSRFCRDRPCRQSPARRGDQDSQIRRYTLCGAERHGHMERRRPAK